MKLRKSVNPSSAFLSTTLHSLDKVLHGGVPCGSLTEVTCLIYFPAVAPYTCLVTGALYTTYTKFFKEKSFFLLFGRGCTFLVSVSPPPPPPRMSDKWENEGIKKFGDLFFL